MLLCTLTVCEVYFNYKLIFHLLKAHAALVVCELENMSGKVYLLATIYRFQQKSKNAEKYNKERKMVVASIAPFKLLHDNVRPMLCNFSFLYNFFFHDSKNFTISFFHLKDS